MVTEAALRYLLTLPPDVFWYSGDEGDPLRSLCDRWSDFSPARQREFEERLLEVTIPGLKVMRIKPSAAAGFGLDASTGYAHALFHWWRILSFGKI